MKVLDYLLEAYDEAAWVSFYQCFVYEKSPVSHIEDDMWRAIKHLVSPDDDAILAWLETKVPALGGHTPAYVLRMGEGKKAMRALLMRMPS